MCALVLTAGSQAAQNQAQAMGFQIKPGRKPGKCYQVVHGNAVASVGLSASGQGQILQSQIAQDCGLMGKDLRASNQEAVRLVPDK